MVKPQIEIPQIAELLSAYFRQPIERLAPVGTGQIASAYSFDAAGQGYIVRFVTEVMAFSFAKDQFARDRLANSKVPVPQIIHIGTVNRLHYAISRRVPGVPLDELSDENYQQTIPAIIETLDAIHQADVSDTQGYGDFDAEGIGRFSNWSDYLLSVADEQDDDGFYGKWRSMFDETFIERELFDYVFARMKSLLSFCPNERYLVHADYGFGNMLAQNGKVTAVLDWANAVYGDFLYDVAWLDIGYPNANYKSLFRQFYQDRNRPIPNYDERILCYQCYISLDSQKWYGKTGKRDDYNWMRGRILGLLEKNESS